MRWQAIPPLGMLTLAAFVVCAITGVMLVPAYSPSTALDSLTLLLLKNPAGVFVRSLHYWSAQAFLVLTLAHIADHLLRRSDVSVRFGVWFRSVLSIPIIFGAMLSGFLLRGDAASTQAMQVLRSLLRLAPLVGAALPRLLTGSEHDLATVYIHHACTATILIWLITADHAHRIMPTARSVLWTCPPLLLISAIIVPALGWRATAVEKGPWYLLGLQEVLHWLPAPGIFVWFLLLGFGLLVYLPRFSAKPRSWLLWSIASVMAGYTVLTVVAFAFRGEGWHFENPGTVLRLHTSFVLYSVYRLQDKALLSTSIPMVSGRREGCLACHREMTGFVPAHEPMTIGCSSCHLGNPWTLNKELAHSGMTLTPGNLSEAEQTCGNSNCHSDVADRVRGSLMNTMSGVVSVDKFAFGENRNLDADFNVALLHRSQGDTHLRQLCASCHLGQDKQHPVPINQTDRGGGCSACHLHYDSSALAELNGRESKTAPLHHPEISIKVRREACFGCHSRSGRISTSYEGWHETLLDEKTARASSGWPAQFRVLEDGRVFERRSPDVHAEAGMSCVDCHLAAEVMGDGRTHSHEENAIRISCIDCHAPGVPPSKPRSQLDLETAQIVAMRKLNADGRRFVTAPAGTAEYPNVFLEAGNHLQVALVNSSKLLVPKPISKECAGQIHRRLECSACHSAWAPQCIQCHTSFDPKEQGWDHLGGRWVQGAWREEPKDYLSDAPTLGVTRKTTPDGRSEERIATFIPGMVIRLDGTSGSERQGAIFRRLFAPASPHTTAAKARDCKSCHANPVALGYGRGELKYEVSGVNAEWRFTPKYAIGAEDGLPEDAWIGFLQNPVASSSTRQGARAFNLDEQHRILLVGACLECHNSKERRLAAAFEDFKNYRAWLSARCRVPKW